MSLSLRMDHGNVDLQLTLDSRTQRGRADGAGINPTKNPKKPKQTNKKSHFPHAIYWHGIFEEATDVNGTETGAAQRWGIWDTGDWMEPRLNGG